MAAWRVFVGDRYGNQLQNLSPIAYDREYSATLNRPARFSFRVPANDDRVRGLHTDSRPYLDLMRTVRAWRQKKAADGSVTWVPRFAGYVWQIEDQGGADTAYTVVTCFDPLQLLNRRLVRRMWWSTQVYGNPFTGVATSPVIHCLASSEDASHAGGQYDIQSIASARTDSQVFAGQVMDALQPVNGPKIPWASTMPGTEVARGLLNCSNKYDGFSGMMDAYPILYWRDLRYNDVIYPSLQWDGDYPPVTPPQSSAIANPTFDNKRVGEAITDLTAQYNSFDIEVRPVSGVSFKWYVSGLASEYGDDSAAIYQVLSKLYFYAPQRGVTRDNVVFGFGIAPHNAKSISRMIDMEAMVNNVRVQGNGVVAQKQNAASIATFGPSLDAQSAADVVSSSILASIAQEELVLGANGKPVYAVVPTVGSFLPFDSFDIGDLIHLRAGSILRGGFDTLQRVYGYTISISNDADSTEAVTQLVVSPFA